MKRHTGLEGAVLWHLDEHIPKTIGKTPTAIPHWRHEVDTLLDQMEMLASNPNLGKKTTTEWQVKIAEMRARLRALLGEK